MSTGAWFKLVCVALYAILVGFLTHGGIRDASIHSQLARAVSADEQIRWSDLSPIDGDRIVGGFARAAMGAGAAIKPEDVYRAPTRSPPAPSLAITAPYLKSGGAPPIKAGDAVRICLNARPAVDKIKVQISKCDDDMCLLTLPFDAATADLLRAGDVARVKIVAADQTCPSN
jgi:hypothetical protein